MADIVGTIATVVIVAIFLMIGTIVYSNFESNVDHSDLTEDASAAINESTEQTYNGFELGALVPYILFAAAILTIIVGAFYRR